MYWMPSTAHGRYSSSYGCAETATMRYPHSLKMHVAATQANTWGALTCHRRCSILPQRGAAGAHQRVKVAGLPRLRQRD